MYCPPLNTVHKFDALRLRRDMYSSLYKTYCPTTDQVVVVKMTANRNEFDVLRHLGPHPNIVKLLGEEANVLVLELAIHGSLYTVLTGGSAVSMAQKAAWVKDIACGLQHIHACGVVHGDIKCENVLIDGGMRARIADFEFSTVGIDMEKQHCTIAYVPPEAFQTNRLDQAGDVYAFAMCMYFIAMGKKPWNGPLEEIEGRVCDGQRPDVKGMRSPFRGYVDLMRLAWHQDKTKRPVMHDIVRRLHDIPTPVPGAFQSMGRRELEAMLSKGVDGEAARLML